MVLEEFVEQHHIDRFIAHRVGLVLLVASGPSPDCCRRAKKRLPWLQTSMKEIPQLKSRSNPRTRCQFLSISSCAGLPIFLARHRDVEDTARLRRRYRELCRKGGFVSNDALDGCVAVTASGIGTIGAARPFQFLRSLLAAALCLSSSTRSFLARCAGLCARFFHLSLDRRNTDPLGPGEGQTAHVSPYLAAILRPGSAGSPSHVKTRRRAADSVRRRIHAGSRSIHDGDAALGRCNNL